MHPSIPAALLVPLQAGGRRAEIFENIYLVFLGLGTLVGVVVIGYTIYNAYKYRDDGSSDATADRPTIGELPTGGGGGRKLFVSFGFSAVIVIGLILWTYTALLTVEAQPDDPDMEVQVEGYQFGWQFTYVDEDANVTVQENGELVVPADSYVLLELTSRDVWHTFGIPEKRVKADAIPGQTSETWFETGAEGEYRAECFELCGSAHSQMTAVINVTDRETFEAWYDQQLQEAREEAQEEEEGGEANGDGEANGEDNAADEEDDAAGDQEENALLGAAVHGALVVGAATRRRSESNVGATPDDRTARAGRAATDRRAAITADGRAPATDDSGTEVNA